MQIDFKKILSILSKKMDEYDHYDDDGFDAQEAEMFQDLQFLQDNRPFRPNMRRRVLRRFDPFDLSPREFYERYRFSKESVEERLIPLLYPDGERAVDGRGHPFTAEQVFFFINSLVLYS